jgi:hypothetical protein
VRRESLSVKDSFIDLVNEEVKEEIEKDDQYDPDRYDSYCHPRGGDSDDYGYQVSSHFQQDHGQNHGGRDWYDDR